MINSLSLAIQMTNEATIKVLERLLEMKTLESRLATLCNELSNNADSYAIAKGVQAGLADATRSLLGEYQNKIRGTPEQRYLEGLLAHYENPYLGMSPNQKYNLKIKDLKLPETVVSLLENHFPDRYVGELVQRTEGEVLGIDGFGPRTFDKVNTELARMSLRFSMEIPGYRPPGK